VYVTIFEPSNIYLQKILFVSANSPLPLSVLAFSNRLVFHSLDFIVSLFIHVSCMILTYVFRWNVLQNTIDISNDNYFEFIINGYMLYLSWASLYFIVMYIILRKRIVKNGNETMFDWAIEHTIISKIKNITKNDYIRQIIYTLIHATLVFCSMLIAPLLWYYKWLHFVYVLFIITIAIWNGSSHYDHNMNKNIKQE
jgi:hypothetical protein